MNGQLRENPVAELIREISLKKFSGRLQLQFEKVKVAVYFKSGALVYAATNLKSLRLSEYLLKSNLITAEELKYLGSQTKDIDLGKTLVAEKRISAAQAEQLQVRLIVDVLRVAMLWTDGTWEFDNRSHLGDGVAFKVDVANILLETGRRFPPAVTLTRFRNPNERFSPVTNPPEISGLLPGEAFLLSRLDAPMSLDDLKALSGQGESETLQMIYSLALVELIHRENWKRAFRDGQTETDDARKTSSAAPETPPEVPAVVAPDPVEAFLDRMSRAESHYEVLDVDANSPMSDLKRAYYDIARKHHPDRYRSNTSILSRVESAFARVTLAYDTLREPGPRATYDSKLEAQRRAARLAQSAPKGTSSGTGAEQPSSASKSDESANIDPAQLAEKQFKDGFAALGLGQRNVALGLLGAAARTMPNEARYRAYYGRALAIHESTRRLAEVELQAAQKLDPGNSEYRIMLAELYRDLGFTVRAKGEVERALAMDANNNKARELLKSLG